MENESKKEEVKLEIALRRKQLIEACLLACTRDFPGEITMTFSSNGKIEVDYKYGNEITSLLTVDCTKELSTSDLFDGSVYLPTGIVIEDAIWMINRIINDVRW